MKRKSDFPGTAPPEKGQKLAETHENAFSSHLDTQDEVYKEKGYCHDSRRESSFSLRNEGSELF